MSAESIRSIRSDVFAIADLGRSANFDAGACVQLVADLLAANAIASRGIEVPGFGSNKCELTNELWLTALPVIYAHVAGHADVLLPDGVRSSVLDNLQPGFIETVRQAVDALPPLRTPEEKVAAAVALSVSFAEWRFLSMTIRDDVVDLVALMAKSAGEDRIYCGHGLSIAVALRLASEGRKVVFAQTSEKLARLAMALAAAFDWNLKARVVDPIVDAQREASTMGDLFALAVLCPPLNMRLDEVSTKATSISEFGNATTQEAAAIVAGPMLASRTLCLVGQGFLFRTTKADQALKERAITRFGLDTVINLPGRPFGGANSVDGALVCLSGLDRDNPEVLLVRTNQAPLSGPAPFVNALPGYVADLIQARIESDHSRIVALSEIAANEFNLMVDRYVLAPELAAARRFLAKEQTVSLEMICEVTRTQSLASKGDPSASIDLSQVESDQRIELREVSVADIDEVGVIAAPERTLRIAPELYRRRRPTLLEAGDVLFVIKGSAGKIAYIRDIPDGQKWIANQSFAILRLRRGAGLSNLRVLFRYLNSRLGQSTIQSLVGGTTIPAIGMSDLKRLEIPLPTIDLQEDISKGVDDIFGLQDAVTIMRREISKRTAALWPDLVQE